MSEALTRLDALRRRAESFQQILAEAARRTTTATYAGSDAAGVVAAAVRGSDGRVTAVTVDDSWRDSVGVEGLPAAVLEAVHAAAISRLGAWSEAFVAAEEAPPGLDIPEDPGTGGGGPPPAPPAANEQARADQPSFDLNHLAAVLEAAERSIDTVTAELRSYVTTGFTEQSRPGHVTATVTGGGAVVQVRYDKRWLTNAHEHNIGTETMEAVTAAYRLAGVRTVTDIVAESVLGRLTQGIGNGGDE